MIRTQSKIVTRQMGWDGPWECIDVVCCHIHTFQIWLIVKLSPERLFHVSALLGILSCLSVFRECVFSVCNFLIINSWLHSFVCVLVSVIKRDYSEMVLCEIEVWTNQYRHPNNELKSNKFCQWSTLGLTMKRKTKMSLYSGL